MQNASGIADVGPFGVAVTGDSGLVRGGPGSHLLVPGGLGGIAVAGRHGHATVGGNNGIVIVGAEGHATASGLAVAREAGAWLLARELGVAVALAAARGVEVERAGIAVGLDRVGRIEAGEDGIAIATCKCPRGGPGSLLVCRGPDGDFRSAIVAPDGEIAPEILLWAKQFERRPGPV